LLVPKFMINSVGTFMVMAHCFMQVISVKYDTILWVFVIADLRSVYAVPFMATITYAGSALFCFVDTLSTIIDYNL